MRYRFLIAGEIIDISPGNKIGEGGEAWVFSIVSRQLAAKIYKQPNQQRERKLTAMLENRPNDPTVASGHISIAWPSDLLLDPQGRFVGYVMPLVAGMDPLLRYYVPALRRRACPLFDYFYLVTTALNVSSAVRALHDRGYAIGDVNESNILVAQTALATVVDTDSFQVPDRKLCLVHRCPVGKPEFTPPELQGRDFKLVDRAPEHDHFGLGVMLFQLLMEGTHPFDGIYSGPGEPPELEQRIASGHFPHGSGARMPIRPKPIAPPFEILEPSLQQLFVQCFAHGHGQPSARPDADTWRHALSRSRELLRKCPANEQHRYWGHVSCPWCERTQRLGGVDPFPSKQAVRQGQHHHRSPGAATPSFTPPRPAPAPARPTPAWPRPVTVPPAPAPVPGRRVRLRVWVVAAVALLILLVILAMPGGMKPGQSPVPSPLDFIDSPQEGKHFRNTLGARMVWVAPGAFKMGDETGDVTPNEKPVHEVRLTTGYWLGETEVTQGQWRQVMSSNPSGFKGDNLPVENVSWDAAVEFCKKLTERERIAGRLPKRIEYRLPTEAQWEYACKAGSTGAYAGDLDAMAWCYRNAGGETHLVATKKANAWGLYDMQGNVWEWCADWFANYSSASADDPTGPENGDRRVDRGGSWFDGGCRSAERYGRGHGYSSYDLGLRLAAVPSGESR